MRPLRIFVSRLRALFRRDVVSQEIADELRFHIDMRTEELERRGMASTEARRSASRRFGNLAVMQDRGYDVRGGGLMETVIKDIRFALHLLRRRPSYSVSAVLTLALGIGLTTTLLSIIDAAWLRPLPFPSPGQLASVTVTTDDSLYGPGTSAPSLPEIRSLRAAGQALDGIGQYHRWEERLVLDDGEPERVKVLTMSEGYIDLYGVPPAVGRTFTVEDARPGAPPVVMLGHAYWQRRFNADRNAVGRAVLVGNVSRTVVGVLPPMLHLETQMWMPESRPDTELLRGSGADVYARVREGVTLRQAEEILGPVARAWPVADRMPRVTGVKLEPLYDEAVASTSEAMSIIVVSALVLVALVCVNVAGLIFADGTNRRREFAVRSSMGAGRGRLMRQLLTEAGVLGAIATVAGVVVAWWSLAAIVSVLPMTLPPHSSPALNGRVLLLATGAAALIVTAITVWPAWALTRSTLNDILSGAAQLQRRVWPRSLGRGIIVAEVALATVLLTSGGLLLRSMDRLLAVDLGFQPEKILTMEVTPLEQTPSVWSTYYMDALVAIRAVHGVAAAGAIDGMPLANQGMIVMAAEPGDELLSDVTSAGVTPGYLEAMGVRLVAGRTFSDEDRGRDVIIIDTKLAQRLHPGREAVGQTLKFPGASVPHTIIGVVGEVKDSPRSSEGTTIYAWLQPHALLPPTFVIRVADGAQVSHDALRQAAQSVGARVLVERIRPGTQLLDERLAIPRHRTVLLSLLAGLGLLLTLIGTAGVTAYAVARRTQEVGVRLAFGATPNQVVRGITLEALRPIALGLAIGLVGAVYGTTVLSAFLFEISEFDPVTVTTVVVLLSVATLVAAWLPARRAARVDPVQALRTE